MKILIKNISILDGAKLAKQDILIDKKIKKIGKLGNEPADKIIEGKGLVALPAFFDMHCHLRDPGFEYKEDIISGSKAAAAGGYAAIACMPNTNPPIDNSALVSYVKTKAENAFCKVYPIGCITKGQQGQELTSMAGLKQAGAVAVSDDGRPVCSGAIMKNALEYAQNFGLTLISHSEDLSISDGGVVAEGYNATISGLRGIGRAAEAAAVARDILLAEESKTSLHLAHISTYNSVELVRAAKKRGVKVTAETCPHYFALTDDEILNYNTNAKINPPLRTAVDVQAIIEGLCDGTIDAIATDHAPHHFDEKNVDFSEAAFGSIGLETAFCVSYSTLVKSGKMKLDKLVCLMSANPAKILGIPKADISEGAEADIVVVDLGKEVEIRADKIASKSKNSVFIGHKYFGEVVLTMTGGRITFEKTEG